MEEPYGSSMVVSLKLDLLGCDEELKMVNNIDDLIHVAIQKEYNTFKLWYNGVQQLPPKSMTQTNAGNNLSIGRHSWNNPGSLINADILRLRFTNDLRYSGDFEVPSLDI